MSCGGVLYLIYLSSVFDLGTAGDYLGYHNWERFSTKDRDNDRSSINCAADPYVRGAWWHRSCKYSNLNGVYQKEGQSGTAVWGSVLIKRSEMKIRPVDLFRPMD